MSAEEKIDGRRDINVDLKIHKVSGRRNVSGVWHSVVQKAMEPLEQHVRAKGVIPNDRSSEHQQMALTVWLITISYHAKDCSSGQRKQLKPTHFGERRLGILARVIGLVECCT